MLKAEVSSWIFAANSGITLDHWPWRYSKNGPLESIKKTRKTTEKYYDDGSLPGKRAPELSVHLPNCSVDLKMKLKTLTILLFFQP